MMFRNIKIKAKIMPKLLNILGVRFMRSNKKKAYKKAKRAEPKLEEIVAKRYLDLLNVEKSKTDRESRKHTRNR